MPANHQSGGVLKIPWKIELIYNAAKQQHVAIRFMTLHDKLSYRSSTFMFCPASKVLLDQSSLRERHKYGYTISKVRPEQYFCLTPATMAHH
jgi:hypothetical protein